MADVPPWAAALGRIPSGLFVLTARNGERETGMLASWVQQCSFTPPCVSVALRKGRELIPVVSALRHWGATHYQDAALVHAACGHPVELRTRCPRVKLTLSCRFPSSSYVRSGCSAACPTAT